MPTKLEALGRELALARAAVKDGEKFIKANQAEYMRLLDEQVGVGAVTYEYSGMRYGRVIAEKATFDVAQFSIDHPDIADQVLAQKITWSLDEEALNEYLAAHPEDTGITQKYIDIVEETRWKSPVVVREEE